MAFWQLRDKLSEKGQWGFLPQAGVQVRGAPGQRCRMYRGARVVLAQKAGRDLGYTQHAT